MDNQTFCSSFWNHQQISTTGEVKPCCRFAGRKKEHDLNNIPINDIFNSNFMKDLRNKSLSGERIEGCKRCYEEQDSGKRSLRQRVNANKGTREYNLDDPKITYLELSISNDCNLACRMCSSRFSHRIYDEEKEYYGKTEIKHKKTRSNIDSAYDLLDSLNYIKFTGGEPLMIKEHWELLQEAVDRNLAKNITLNYSTNNTILPKQKHQELWKHFHKIELCVSLDSIKKEENEYQRHHTNHQQALSNIKEFVKFYQKGVPIRVVGRPTITIMNVMHVPETIEWLLDAGVYPVNATHLTFPAHQSITVLPLAAKNKIKEKFEAYNYKLEDTRLQCQYLINYMFSKDNSHLWPEFKKHTEFLDRSRNQDFKNTYPYYNQCL